MKRTILLSYIALVIAVVLSAAAGRGAESAPEETASPMESAAPETTPQPLPAPERISLLTEDGILEMDMQEYLVGVVAAEMPAAFPDEALKAQAVAARTYAMNCAAGKKHGDAQVCADYKCCQAWQDDAALHEKWGVDYDMYIEKIRAAVAATEGQYLSYDGEAVFAAFHSSSAGATEASGSIWSERPYLISVSSPETEEDVPNFVSRVDCTELDFRGHASLPRTPKRTSPAMRRAGWARSHATRADAWQASFWAASAYLERSSGACSRSAPRHSSLNMTAAFISPSRATATALE